ncbi:LysR family transcriptional regulator [Dactylosporangium vinaceum]|uniref:LysR family transcriptional regulator n=1 Tax=Dactylosporangium vinaceum TaxID=53362 RepID=A0ABV5M0B7_9ACTN|nr:LysR substrate-binding domain-containing protein [Dactylosporangium vinaceum]UAB98205.1 LysR family transcriptional regulator [Dactylosporangium vinaceum]
MQTEMLEVFREVARQRSITGAAATLRYTQSAVSRQMAALEAEFGAPLFDRLPRGVALTSEGRCLLEHATAVLDRLTAARREVRAVTDALIGRLRVGAFATADAALVPRALARFRASHPDVEIALIEGLTSRLLASLLVDDADVVLVSSTADRPFTDDRFEVHHVAAEPLLLAVPAAHPLARSVPHHADARADASSHADARADASLHADVRADASLHAGDRADAFTGPVSAPMADGALADAAGAGRVVRLEELADASWVAGAARPEETLLAASARLGYRPRIDFVVQEWTAKLGFVAAGLGVTLVPAFAARIAPRDVVLLPLDPAEVPPRLVVAATLAGRTVPSVVAAFLSLVRAEAAIGAGAIGG